MKTENPTKSQIKATKDLIKWLVIAIIGWFAIWVSIRVLTYPTQDLDIWLALGIVVTCMFSMCYGTMCLYEGLTKSVWCLLKATGYEIVKVKKKKRDKKIKIRR